MWHHFAGKRKIVSVHSFVSCSIFYLEMLRFYVHLKKNHQFFQFLWFQNIFHSRQKHAFALCESISWIWDLATYFACNINSFIDPWTIYSQSNGTILVNVNNNVPSNRCDKERKKNDLSNIRYGFWIVFNEQVTHKPIKCVSKWSNINQLASVAIYQSEMDWEKKSIGNESFMW